MIHRTAPFSMTLNDPTSGFKVTPLFDVTQKRYEIQTQFQWSTNKDLHTPYSTVSFRMTLSDPGWLSKYSMRRSARGISATAELLV